jgi:ribosome maturation factor RimP
MSSPKVAVHGIDRDALLRVVEPIVRAHRAELVDVEFKPGRGGWILRLFIEKEGSAERNLSTRDAAVDLELCAKVSRDLSPALDVADLIPHAYQLEIGSPGVERTLRSERDFVRFSGLKVKLKLRGPSGGGPSGGGPRVVVGRLDGMAEGKVRVYEGERALEVPLGDVESARLVFEFGASATGRPGPGHGKRANRVAPPSGEGGHLESDAGPQRGPIAKRH